MSDETRDDAQDSEVTRPRPRPAPAPATEPEESAATEPAVDETDTEPTIATPPAPVSATSRARRIGGRPIIPTAPPVGLDKNDSGPPTSAGGRHQAAAPPAKEPKARAVKEPKSAKQPRTGRRGVSAAWAPAGVLGIAALVLIVLIGIASHGVYWAKNGVSSSTRTTTQQAALAAAKTCIATINTYNYEKMSTAEAAAQACTTGKFSTCLKSVYQKELIPKAPAAKAVQTAQVNQAGIKDIGANGTQIDILIYGQLTLTNVSTSASSPEYEPFGAVATMDKVGAKWLVAAVQADVGGSVAC